MKKLKIALVESDTIDKTDGVPQYVLTIGQWLAAQGHEVHYLVGETKRTDLPNIHSLARNKKVRYNGNRLSLPLPVSKRLLREQAQQNFDIVHVQVPYSPVLAGRLLKVLPPSTPVVGTFHVLPYGTLARYGNKLLALINKRTARRFTTMISSTQPTAAFAKAVYGFDSVIIPHPIRLADFQPIATKASIPTIVFLGRLVERKGARQLIEAVAYLRERKLYTRPFRVIIGGKGEQLEALQALVTEKNLRETISFTGFVDEADKASFLSQADIAVFPSIGGESFGISLLEALATARGVVLGGDNPGYRAVLGPLGEDHLCDPVNTLEFAEKLAFWLTNPAARQQAATAQKNYVQQFDIDVIGPQVIEVYNQALRGQRNVP